MNKSKGSISIPPRMLDLLRIQQVLMFGQYYNNEDKDSAVAHDHGN